MYRVHPTTQDGPGTPAAAALACIQVSVRGCGVGGSSSISSASLRGVRGSLGGSGWISFGTCSAEWCCFANNILTCILIIFNIY